MFVKAEGPSGRAKIRSDDLKRALGLAQYLRTIGYSARIEDTNGNEIDEKALDVEQGGSDWLNIGGQLVELLPALARNAGRRHIKIASEVERHRSVQEAAHGRDVIIGVSSPDPLEHLVKRVGIGEDVMRCFPIFAWIGRNRRLAKDFEGIIDSARAFLYAASVMLLVRRIARSA